MARTIATDATGLAEQVDALVVGAAQFIEQTKWTRA